MDIPLAAEPGAVLPVPVLRDCPWVFELEVKQTIPLDDSDVFICKIRNVLADKALTDESVSVEERMRLTDPIVWTGAGGGQYFTVDSAGAGRTGDWKDLYAKNRG